MPPTHETRRRHRRAPPPTASARSAWWIAPALIVLTIAAYAPVRHFDFVTFDDQLYVTSNPHVRAGLTWAGFVWAFSTGYAANWHPLTWLSHMLDVTLFGLAPGPHHVTSLVWHAINGALVWTVLRRLSGSVWRSALVAALFAVHPLHVESVAWVAERKDVLSACFALLTLWAWAGYVRRPGSIRYLGALGCFALGLLAKPMLVTLPLVMVLLDVWPLRRLASWAPPDGGAAPALSWRRSLREKLPFFILAIGSSVVTFVVQQRGGAVSSLDLMSPGARVVNALASALAYLRQTVWPTGLAAFYPRPASPPVAMAATALVVLLLVTILAVRVARTRPYLLVGWLWFLVMLAPVIGLVQIGAQTRADRYTYLPHIGLFVAGIWGLADLAARWALPRRVVAAVALIVVAACGVATRIQAGYWQDGIALWQRAVAVTAGNSRAHTNLGTSLAAAGRSTEAIAEYRAALEIEPTLPQAHYNLGLALLTNKETDGAIREFREAVRLMPDYAEARDGLANALMDLGQVDEALAQYTEAVRRRPDNAQFHNNLGAALAGRGRMADATQQFLEAVRLEPDRAEWRYAAGMAYAVQGATVQAIACLQEALRLDPHHDRARRALADLERR